MASFELKRRDTGIIYTIKVSEFVFRNAYSTNTQNIATSLEPTGYTTVTSLGDNIVQKLGQDAVEQGAWFEFVNHPDYSIHLDGLRDGGVYYRLSDPTLPALADPTTYVYTVRVGTINVYYQTSILRPFMTYYKIVCKDINTDKTINNMLPNFTNMPNVPKTGTTFGFNFIQKQIALISPYYYRVQSFDDGNKTFNWNYAQQISYGNCSPIYIGEQFTIKNSISNSDSRYNMNSGESIDTATIKKYKDLDSIEYIYTAGGQQIHATDTMSIISGDYQIAGKNIYDFWYWLLYDTDTDSDSPYGDNNDKNNPSGQSPTNTGGNPNGGNPTSDNVIFPTLPTVNPISTGSVNLYQMSVTTFRDFMKYLWGNVFYTSIIKLFENPFDAVISAHMITAIVPTTGNDYITIGNVKTDVNANIVPNNFINVDFGNLQISEFYSDASDYMDSIVELYLPYYGYVTLNTMEVMNANIHLRYVIDVLTGDFVAIIRVVKEIDGTNLDSVMYQYNGNMAYQIPLSSIDYSSIVTATINAVGALSQKKISKVGDGLLNAALSVDIGYDRAGMLSGNTGYMSVKQAYVAILRPIHNLPPNFSRYLGFPYEGYVNLGSCSGYTKCREVFIDKVFGTETEMEMIKSMLLQGVIF